jgi:hypothetical protein
MLAGAVLTYGFLMSFVLSAAARNKRQEQTNPAILNATGFLLCGLTAGLAIILPVWATMDPAAVQALSSLI